MAQQLPATVSGLAQVYDVVTLDLVQRGSRYRTVIRIRLESVRLARSGRRRSSMGSRDLVALARPPWLVSVTLSRTVECRPTRLLKDGGYLAQCFAGGRDIGADGLRVGMFVLVVPPGEAALPGYSELEENAKRGRAGNLSSDFVMPADWRRANGSYNPLLHGL